MKNAPMTVEQFDTLLTSMREGSGRKIRECAVCASNISALAVDGEELVVFPLRCAQCGGEVSKPYTGPRKVAADGIFNVAISARLFAVQDVLVRLLTRARQETIDAQNAPATEVDNRIGALRALRSMAIEIDAELEKISRDNM